MTQARAACKLSDDRGEELNTLGAALYRAAQYKEVLQVLLRSEKKNAEKFGGSIPGDLAFLVMTYHKLGKTDETKKTMDRLGESMKKVRGSPQDEADMLLAEVEVLLKGK